jgi:chemotaxis response regulator CheB
MNLNTELVTNDPPPHGMADRSGPQKRSIRVLTVDDHPGFRAGIAAMLSNEPDVRLVGEASSGAEAVAQYRTLHPDIMLLDLQMPQMRH